MQLCIKHSMTYMPSIKRLRIIQINLMFLYAFRIMNYRRNAIVLNVLLHNLSGNGKP